MSQCLRRFFSVFGVLCCLAFSSAYAGTIELLRLNGSSPVDLKLREAVVFLAHQKLPEAEAGFQAALRMDSKRVESFIGMAEVLKERGQPALAEVWFRRALDVKGGTALAYRAWGRYLSGNHRVRDAEGAFRKSAAIDSASPDSLVDLGDMELAGGKTEDAIRDYRAAIARKSDSYLAHLGLGSALAGANHLDAATAEFQESVRLKRSAPAAWLSLGLAYGAAGEQDKAVEALSEALKIDASLVRAWVSRGDAFQTKGDSARAISDYSQALKLDPKAGIVHLKIGLAHLAAKQVTNAEHSFQTAVQIDGGIASAWNDLAWIAADRKSSLEMALVWAKKAVSLEPRNPEFIDTLAWVYRARHELDLAAQTIGNFPPANRPPVLFYHLGVINSERGRTAEALAALRMSLVAGEFTEADQARKLLAALSRR